ncbi:MAG: LysM peptidoglycan-binding domain-containing protein [Clostridia bacterium]|nr:LysM peptidoglycan-binding domain-containing protein [Clostridia bacterium]
MKKFFYRVQKGDTVLAICQRFSCSMGKLIFINQLKSEVSAGDILLIERERKTYLVKPIDTIEKIANKFCISPQSILEKNCVPYIFCGLIIAI